MYALKFLTLESLNAELTAIYISKLHGLENDGWVLSSAKGLKKL